MKFRVQQIDHVEFFVPDRFAAADWYAKTLGLQPVPEFASWAQSATGPLMITTAQGGTKLALFEGEPRGDRPTAGYHLVAFLVDAAGFLTFLDLLPELDLLDKQGRPLTREAVSDHQLSWSIYFCDPWGHHIEITTYEYKALRAKLL